MKQLFSKAKNCILNNKHMLYIFFLFFIMDLITRVLGYKTDFYPAYYPVPNIFTILWIILFIGIITSLKGKAGKIAYWIIFGLFFILFLTNNVYYSTTSLFFSFHLLQLTDEGSSYILDAILNTNPIVYIAAIIIIIMAIIISKKIPKLEKNNYNRLIIAVIIFLALHNWVPFLLGSANSHLQWNSFNNARNVYDDFSDANRSMKVSGLYEYSFRNLYITYLKPEAAISDDDKEFLDNIYNTEPSKSNNEYTGIFNGKNVIFLQLEGLDSWLFNEEVTPNLYSLLDHSINFTNHYSLYTGGGSTFNSEFAVNTGFTTPISYVENVYSFSNNTFPHTMAKLFKQQGYGVNAFHMNSSDYYSRGVNYKSWGYDNYFGLIDIQSYENGEEELDRNLILNETFYENMFQTNKPFVNYIITYSPHTPFSSKKKVGYLVAKEKYGVGNVPDLSEEESAKLQAGETDYMVGLLIQALKDNDLYDNTVIVAYADHYLYTLKDKSILSKYKETQNNLINHTPFFIWSSDLEPDTIDKVNMQTDILPTVLNMFGMDYNSNNYIGHDILDDSYSGYAFFSDYSWFDGKMYVNNGELSDDANIDTTELLATRRMIRNIIKKNDLTLKYDYFKSK